MDHRPTTESPTTPWAGVDRDENGQKRSVNTKTISIFVFFLPEMKSKTLTPKTETISVFRKHRKRKFGTENTSVRVKT
jgi:hypothetical protein